MLMGISYLLTPIRRISNTTIFALSSGFGKCGVAVVRVSGPETKTAITSLTKTVPSTKNLKPRYASLRKLWHPKTNDLIDKGLVLFFPAPHSFTGEDCCEFQVHGSPAVVSAICDALNSIDGFRPALAGEFAKRAFRNEKLDLIEIEGLADLIHAETDIQRKQALLQADGALSSVYAEWRQTLLRAVACFEAYIDFAEDDDIEPETINQVQSDVDKLINEIERFLNDSRKGEMRRNGVKTAILGEPNVGKSSFMNHICQKPISIVASIEGTTRDIVESSFNIAGFPVVIADTAGLRHHTHDPIEKEGIQRAKQYAAEADLIILIVDVNKLLASDMSLHEFKRKHLNKMGITEDNEIMQKEIIVIANKCDLVDKTPVMQDNDIVFVSCTENHGIDGALKKIEETLRQLTDYSPLGLAHVPPNERHRQFLVKCLQHLREFKTYSSSDGFDFSIAAVYLRESQHQLENISGRTIHIEEMYDFIFKQFCIGK
ncbi:uncharacterized protein LOC116352488 [Contarinia nasturtii]|uniref:uncharacterized protein LOC116352488 n=1 Tax=Contarinia nasturtii TaxID=265458 RepID=UPI0012D4BB86|nr:uncharacterized protein LOC116352488 [Contarinia nasturtii]